jgi:hypothetical protein
VAGDLVDSKATKMVMKDAKKDNGIVYNNSGSNKNNKNNNVGGVGVATAGPLLFGDVWQWKFDGTLHAVRIGGYIRVRRSLMSNV